MKKNKNKLIIIFLTFTLLILVVFFIYWFNNIINQNKNLLQKNQMDKEMMAQLMNLEDPQQKDNQLKNNQGFLDFSLEKNQAQKLTNLEIAQLVDDFLNEQQLEDNSYNLGKYCKDDSCQSFSDNVSIPRLAPYILWGKYNFYKKTNQLEKINNDIATIHYAHIKPQPHAHFNCTLLFDIYSDNEASAESKEKLQTMCNETQWEVADVAELYDTQLYNDLEIEPEILFKQISQNINLIKNQQFSDIVNSHEFENDIFLQYANQDKLIPYIHFSRLLHFVSELATVEKWQLDQPIINSFPKKYQDLDATQIAEVFFNKSLINYAILEEKEEEFAYQNHYLNYKTNLALASYSLFEITNNNSYLDFCLYLISDLNSLKSASSYTNYAYLLNKLINSDYIEEKQKFEKELNKIRDYLIMQNFDYKNYPANQSLNLTNQQAFFKYKNQYETQFNAYMLGILSL